MNSSNDSLLTVKQVAERLNVSTSLVYQLVDNARIAAHRLGNGRGTIRVGEQDLHRYLRQCRNEKTERAPSARRVALKHIRL